jgi:hypothetical protein
MTDQEPTLKQDEPEQEDQPMPRYSYRAMFQLLADGRVQKVCRQKPPHTAWIVAVNGHYYRDVYDTKTWLVHYDLLSNEEFQVVLDELLPSVTPSVEAK